MKPLYLGEHSVARFDFASGCVLEYRVLRLMYNCHTFCYYSCLYRPDILRYGCPS